MRSFCAEMITCLKLLSIMNGETRSVPDGVGGGSGHILFPEAT